MRLGKVLAAGVATDDANEQAPEPTAEVTAAQPGGTAQTAGDARPQAETSGSAARR